MNHSRRIPAAAHLACATVMAVLTLATACHRASSSSGAGGKRYDLTGTVLGKDVAAGQLTIANNDIPGFMSAMTMPYPVKDAAALRDAQPGDHISAQVVIAADGQSYWLENVVLGGAAVANPTAPAQASAPEPLRVAAAVAAVPMVTQDGKTLRLRDLHGKAVLLTFIYTRCPMPTACPLLTSRFAQIESDLAKNPIAYSDSHLISISLDPVYDRPPVLRKYGLAYLDDNAAAFTHWSFVETTPADLRILAQAFGLEYSVDGNQISHSMRTVLIAPDENVADSWDGSAWDSGVVAEAVEKAVSDAAR